MKIVPPPFWDCLDPKGPKNAKKSIWAQKVYRRPFRPTLYLLDVQDFFHLISGMLSNYYLITEIIILEYTL